MLVAVWHFSFTVSDIEQSIRFYRDVVGMELIHTQEQANAYTRNLVGYPDAHLKVAMFRIPGWHVGRSGHMLELIEYVAPKGENLRHTHEEHRFGASGVRGGRYLCRI